MIVQIQLFCEYRDPQGKLCCEPADDPFLMDLDDWERDDPAYDRVKNAVFNLRFDGVTCFDGPATAHSGDDSWTNSQYEGHAEYRGRVRLVGFTPTQLDQIRQRVAD